MGGKKQGEVPKSNGGGTSGEKKGWEPLTGGQYGVRKNPTKKSAETNLRRGIGRYVRVKREPLTEGRPIYRKREEGKSMTLFKGKGGEIGLKGGFTYSGSKNASSTRDNTDKKNRRILTFKADKKSAGSGS